MKVRLSAKLFIWKLVFIHMNKTNFHMKSFESASLSEWDSKQHGNGLLPFFRWVCFFKQPGVFRFKRAVVWKYEKELAVTLATQGNCVVFFPFLSCFLNSPVPRKSLPIFSGLVMLPRQRFFLLVKTTTANVLCYLTIITRVRVGYEMTYSQR